MQRQYDSDNCNISMGKCLTLRQNWFGIRKWCQYMKNKYLIYESCYLSFDVIQNIIVIWLYVKIARELRQDRSFILKKAIKKIKCTYGFALILHIHIGFKMSWRLYLKLCCHIWLSSVHSPVRIFIPLRLWHLKVL